MCRSGSVLICPLALSWIKWNSGNRYGTQEVDEVFCLNPGDYHVIGQDYGKVALRRHSPVD
jgi:hypothetical protein